jgi:hypothetical protein
MFFREIFNVAYDMLKAKRQFLQVLFGPRQVGKITKISIKDLFK